MRCSTAPRACAVRSLRALREVFENFACFVREVSEAHALTLAVFFVELHLTRIVLERGKERNGRRISQLRERFDRGSDSLSVRMLEKAPEQPHAAGLTDLREEERQLRERRASLRKSVDRTFDSERNLLETIERKPLERFARMDARLRRVAAENIDEEVDGLRALEITEESSHSRETQGRLLTCRRGPRGRGDGAQLFDELARVARNERLVKVARSALSVE